METPEAAQWQEAVDSECSSVVKNKVPTFVDSIPTRKRAIPTKLILQRKLGSGGETIRYKARLVAQGFRQVEGLDFAETFAPVASLSSVRIVLAIAGTRGYAVHQMDVVTAFLGSKLDEEIYVHLPLGVLGGPRMARLNRSLYGLKQWPQYWYTTIDEFLVSHLGFRRGGLTGASTRTRTAQSLLFTSMTCSWQVGSRSYQICRRSLRRDSTWLIWVWYSISLV